MVKQVLVSIDNIYWRKLIRRFETSNQLLPVTRQSGSGSMGLEPSFRLRTKKSLKEAYLSRGKAASSKSRYQQNHIYAISASQFIMSKLYYVHDIISLAQSNNVMKSVRTGEW